MVCLDTVVLQSGTFFVRFNFLLFNSLYHLGEIRKQIFQKLFLCHWCMKEVFYLILAIFT